MKLQWKAIDERYMHGIYAQRDERTAEVVKCYQGKWTAFYVENGTQVILGFNPPYRTFNGAKSDAAYYLNTGRIRLFNK